MPEQAGGGGGGGGGSPRFGILAVEDEPSEFSHRSQSMKPFNDGTHHIHLIGKLLTIYSNVRVGVIMIQSDFRQAFIDNNT